MPFVLVALVLAVLVGAYLVSQPSGSVGTAKPPRATQPRATSPAPSKAVQTSPATTAPSAVTVAPGTGSDKKLAAFVRSYYSDVTSKRDRTWAELTPRMQARAGGRGGYDGFWRTIRKVRVNSTQANASANVATVNLTYTRVDGSTSTETHRSTFVSQGGRYLIDTDR